MWVFKQLLTFFKAHYSIVPLGQWKGINCKQSTRWQHLSRLKASAFFSLQFFLLLWNTTTYTLDWYCHLVGDRASFICTTFIFASVQKIVIFCIHSFSFIFISRLKAWHGLGLADLNSRQKRHLCKKMFTFLHLFWFSLNGKTVLLNLIKPKW
jgi:hypothetical protein